MKHISEVLGTVMLKFSARGSAKEVMEILKEHNWMLKCVNEVYILKDRKTDTVIKEFNNVDELITYLYRKDRDSYYG